MKQIQTLIAVLLCSCAASFAQYAGISATGTGPQFHAGFIAGGLEIAGTFKVPLFNQEQPTIASLSFGKQILLTKNDIGNFTLTPSLGIASYKRKDFTKFDSLPDGEIVEISEVKPIFNLEAGKDFYMGRLFIAASYCGSTYFSFGFKAFFSTNR